MNTLLINRTHKGNVLVDAGMIVALIATCALIIALALVAAAYALVSA